MIKYIFAHKLHIQSIPDPEKPGQYLNGAIYGGGYDQNGNPTGGPGFHLGTDGRLRADGIIAENGKFSGEINANGGIFNDITITGKSLFSGDIIAGPIIAKNAPSSPPPARNFSANDRVSTVWNALGTVPYSGWQTIDIVYGKYGSNDKLIRLNFECWQTPNQEARYALTLVYNDGSTFTIPRYSANNPEIGNTLQIGGGGSGKILRFIDLPVGGASTPGDIYRNANGQLFVKV
jgi:hypothetical protein